MFNTSNRVPKINIRNNNGTIQVRFQYQYKQYQFSPGGKYDDPIALSNAKTIAETIKRDILIGQFDPTLQKYLPKVIQPENVTVLPNNNPNLKELWEQYKVAKRASVSETNQKHNWVQTDRCLAKVPDDALKPENAYTLVPELLKSYSSGTLERVLIEIASCSNWAYEHKLINHNAWNKLKKQLPPHPTSTRTKKAFTKEEVDAIIDAFHNNTYCSKASAYKDSYYTDFVRFLFFTGCRPEDAIALRWDNVKDNVIVFAKSYSKGVLKDTKTHEVRTFPINTQLREFLESRCNPKARVPSKLVFPAPKSGYIDLHNFTNRYWSRVVHRLQSDGKVSKYLPTYNLRNTSATLFLKKGVDKATIAALLGTSEKMLDEHYWSPDDDILTGGVKLPEL